VRNVPVMRVAIFTDTYAQVNGVAVTIDEMVRYARARGIALDVYTQVGEPDSVEELGSVRVLRFRMLAPIRINEGLSLDLRMRNRRVLARMRQDRPDVVHLEAHGTMGVAGKAFARRLGIPVVGSFNTDIPSYIGPFVDGALPWLDGRIRRRITAVGEHGAWALTRRLFGGCDLVLAPSQFTRAALAERLERPVALFPRGVDTEIFTPRARSRQGGAGERPVALYVGRFSAEKNLGLLVDLFRSRNDLALQLVGSGPLVEWVQSRLPGAEYLGVIRGRAELARVFASADILVMPSETETFGQVIAEAAACGLPAVVSGVGAACENVDDGASGIVAHSPAQFAAALDRLAGDPELRQSMGEHALRLGARMAWDRIFDGLFARYGELLAGRSVDRRD
jgi:glycosyltransferase involved in cell wall biosynthesis